MQTYQRMAGLLIVDQQTKCWSASINSEQKLEQIGQDPVQDTVTLESRGRLSSASFKGLIHGNIFTLEMACTKHLVREVREGKSFFPSYNTTRNLELNQTPSIHAHPGPAASPAVTLYTPLDWWK